MDRPFECPDCRTRHDEPAQPALGTIARCLDCELESLYRADRDSELAFIPRAA
jgi:hypothetical protein